MTRRGFIGAIAAAFVAPDPEQLLWRPGARLISVPAPRPWIGVDYGFESASIAYFIAKVDYEFAFIRELEVSLYARPGDQAAARRIREAVHGRTAAAEKLRAAWAHAMSTDIFFGTPAARRVWPA